MIKSDPDLFEDLRNVAVSKSEMNFLSKALMKPFGALNCIYDFKGDPHVLFFHCLAFLAVWLGCAVLCGFLFVEEKFSQNTKKTLCSM